MKHLPCHLCHQNVWKRWRNDSADLIMNPGDLDWLYGNRSTWKLTSSHLKMDGSKINFLSGNPIFKGKLLVLGRVDLWYLDNMRTNINETSCMLLIPMYFFRSLEPFRSCPLSVRNLRNTPSTHPRSNRLQWDTGTVVNIGNGQHLAAKTRKKNVAFTWALNRNRDIPWNPNCLIYSRLFTIPKWLGSCSSPTTPKHPRSFMPSLPARHF